MRPLLAVLPVVLVVACGNSDSGNSDSWSQSQKDHFMAWCETSHDPVQDLSALLMTDWCICMANNAAALDSESLTELLTAKGDPYANAPQRYTESQYASLKETQRKCGYRPW